jgi:hypothetical protein
MVLNATQNISVIPWRSGETGVPEEKLEEIQACTSQQNIYY